MRERSNSPVFLIVLILSILIMVIGIMMIAKNDTAEVKRVQEQIQTSEKSAEELSDVIQNVNDDIQSGYDKLDEGINGAF